MLTRENAVCQDSHVDLKVEEEGNVCFIMPEGKMAAGCGDQPFKEELERLLGAGKKRIVIDFSKVPYIDSSVLGHLVHGYSTLRKEGGSLKLLNPSKRIIDLLTLTRLLPVFEVYQTREQVLSSWPA